MAYGPTELSDFYRDELRSMRRVARRPIVTRTFVFAPNQTTTQRETERQPESERERKAPKK